MTNTSLTTMTDIARKAGVTQSTVSLALGNHPRAARLSQKTKDQIRKIAEEMGYQHSAIAQAMATGKTNTIGIMLWGITALQVPRIIDGIMDRANNDNLLLKIFKLESLVDNQAAIKAAIAQRLTGIICIGADAKFANKLNVACKPFNIPSVYITGDEKIDPRQRVFSDDRNGILKALEHLKKQGHQEIHYLAHETTSQPQQLRHDAFLKAANKLNIKQRKIIKLPLVDDWDHSDNQETAYRYIQEKGSTACICGSDMMAYLLIRGAMVSGLNLPKDLSIIGIADYAFSSVTYPALTTIHQPFGQMGYRAASLLLDMKQGKGIKSIQEAQSLNILPTELCVRESTSPPRN